MIPLARPLLGAEERDAVVAVLESGMLAAGARVEAFEREFAEATGVRHAIAVSSGTAALYVALQAHGVGPGDEVITTPFTFGATANVVLALGARAVFVDIEPDTFNLDPAQVEAAITPHTRAIIPVHLYGHPAELRALTRIADQHGLALIEDACQAHAALYHGRAVGTFGTGCYSFYPTKNMTTGEGGMITTDSDEIAELARAHRNHGQRYGRYLYDVVGLNWRMTDLAAAIGSVQLRKLPAWTARRRANAARLTAGVRGVIAPVERAGCAHVYHQYTVRVPDGQRNLFAAELVKEGVSNGIYYPLPLHRTPLYRQGQEGWDDRFPNADNAAAEVLSLPVHPALSDEDVAAVIAAVNRVADRLGLTGGCA
ncbi:MAG: DegT/DnrJ/EryC1/StrS family aminotransferase [Dehalococcoidia bacterium]|nr:DegT/DnrJ/EryC1/StrS family aminotransferase [Dehalococcoidia bacterium]